jgi:flavin reductase (DIM6/NTAB) family NADH-FMN oxidoreductase RutF
MTGLVDTHSTGLRAAMARFPTGVAIITSMADDGRPWGMTCSSLCSVTLSPPTLLVCLRESSPTLAALLEHGGFAVNLLHDGAKTTAELFASGAPDRFDSVRWSTSGAAAGPHLVDDAHMIVDCDLRRADVVGDHTVVYGEVSGVRRRPPRPPLLYGLHGYASWPGEGVGRR